MASSANCFNTNSLAVDPTGRFVYAANYSQGAAYGYDVDQGSGALTAIPGSPFSAGPNTIHLAIDASGRFVYVTVNSIPTGVDAYAVAGTRQRERPTFGPGNSNSLVTGKTTGNFPILDAEIAAPWHISHSLRGINWFSDPLNEQGIFGTDQGILVPDTVRTELAPRS